MSGKVGFCCMVLGPDNRVIPRYKYHSATVKYVRGLPMRERERYVRERVEANCRALYETVNVLRKQPPGLRMFRITSGFFPLFTHESVTAIYDNTAWMNTILDALAKVGAQAREHDVRLSLHPGQHVVLNSADEAKRLRAVQDFEYHTLVAQMLGYNGRGHDTFAINVHGGLSYTKSGLLSWDRSWRDLSKAARRLITLENDEFQWNASQIVALCERLQARPVLDVHHQWIAGGRWLNPRSASLDRVLALWDGARPKLHLSTCLPYFLDPAVPDRPAREQVCRFDTLPQPNHRTRADLRIHSDYIWSHAMVPYMAAWLERGWDIMVEAKAKNLASFALYRDLKRYGAFT